MISPPLVLQTEAQDAAVIRLTIPRSEMMRQFGPAVAELLRTLHEQGIEPIGGAFAHHLRMSPETFDFELGIKVARLVQPSGRVQPGALPAAKVARTTYSGGYEGLPAAWGEFNDWMTAKQLQQAGDLWEVYAVGPQSSSDPADWRTELNRPLKG